MRTDLEKILVAKGFKITGPFDSIDVMTFPDKKTANLTLTPMVDVRATQQVTKQTAAIGIFPGEVEGVYVVGGWISLVLLEPLTGEKIWIKKIEVNPVQEVFFWKYYATQRRNQAGQVMTETRTVEDTRGHAVAAALGKIYPEALQKAWDYLHPDEVMMVNQHAEEARKLKRY